MSLCDQLDPTEFTDDTNTNIFIGTSPAANGETRREGGFDDAEQTTGQEDRGRDYL
jgi:hypothetical protein